MNKIVKFNLKREWSPFGRTRAEIAGLRINNKELLPLKSNKEKGG